MTEREDSPPRCGAYFNKYDVVCVRWLDHFGSHRSQTTDEDGWFSFVQWDQS